MSEMDIGQIPSSGGILILDKPSGMTSHDAVNKIRRLYGTKQVGHTGTLDPLATGVLCILVGRAVKASEFSLTHPKTYQAETRLGFTTDTDDITGSIMSEAVEINPDHKDFASASRSFLGAGFQTPPMYSAVKVGGKKLYELARAGITVDRDPKPVFVYSITTEHTSGNDYRFWCTVSSGTYIRTLCRDIGEKLNTGACMISLRRLSACGFDINQAFTLEQLESMSLEERISLLLPTETLFLNLDTIVLNPFYERLFRSGCALSLSKIGIKKVVENKIYRVYGESSGFFALGKTSCQTETPTIKSIKLFSI